MPETRARCLPLNQDEIPQSGLPRALHVTHASASRKKRGARPRGRRTCTDDARLKILYITEIFPDPHTGLGFWGGGERQFYELAKRTAEKGHRVTVLTCSFPGQLRREILDGMEIRRVGMTRDARTGVALMSPARLALYLAATAKEAAGVGCDLIHCNAYYPVMVGRIVAAMKRVPLVCTFHDVPGPGTWTEYARSRIWGRLGYFATRAAVSAANGPVVAVSEQTKRKLSALGKRNLQVIPNGVDIDLLDAAHTDKTEGQVLYVGRLVRYKRVDNLLRAFAEVVAKAPEARLIVIGNGPERAALERLAVDLPRGRVVFRGTVPSHEEVARTFRESSLFVLPSELEGEGIVVKEAMAASLPVIAVDIPTSGVLGLVKDGWNGLLVRPGDPLILAKAILNLLSDPEKRKTMGGNARETAEKWTWGDASERMLKLYRTAVAGGR